MHLAPIRRFEPRRPASHDRRHVLFAATLLAAVALSSTAAPAQTPATGPQPRLEIDQPEIDLGTLDRGAKATARFELRNAGDAPLRILRVNPG